MNFTQIWNDVGARIGFFTKATAHRVPSIQGVYAWFLPLHLFDENLSNLLSIVKSFLLFDATCGSTASSQISCAFRRESTDVSLEISIDPRVSDNLTEMWDAAIREPEARLAIQRSLMESSIFLPPLYVGKANNLKDRYDQHVQGVSSHFHERFSAFSERISQQYNVTLSVGNLLFVCVRTDPVTSQEFARPPDHKPNLNYLLEQVLMRMSPPPFCVR